ncbi:filamentous hemagglutinin N-terminal domain-containing protein [Verminephrobacter aporrectodeae subsp. tuberculatae]|uniref:two-partner secretion domain-containing protein n=1 Tax=Verminephrobacter aporrectodeae TaxID=1110389 RepID=UPI002243F2B8|nr:hemagglutinin repeat-containing protein [Verminephrobacter aporrectodeae]MCW8197320.1 filamentous hemagglutinin N-terminal domain-containing protein [Verminephrobacter aporrectodeae subsp. tuberculatae]
MNQHRHRIIFNQARGILMAVAETARGHGGAGGEAPAPGHTLLATIKPLTFLVWGLLGLVMAPAARAQIIADPNAPGNQRATVLSAPNTVPLVNVQTPSAAGVSRNTYSQFDVQPQGAILNNSRTNVQTQLGGWVQGNPWMAKGSARVILNEVHSSNPSLLRGYVEVAGQRAQVVIANPSGVGCDGCGFINAQRATVTTGTPLMNGGNLEGFRVQRGTVTVTGNGMDAKSTDYTDLIARAVQAHAGIWAKELKVLTGANQVHVDQDTGDSSVGQTTAGTGTAPGFAMDSAQLGGMYAEKITLLATEAGVGVRNAGKLYASAGDVLISADGQLQNAGQITSSAQTRIDTQQGVQNTGTIHARGNAEITTRADIDNRGVLAAQGDTTLNATGARSQITSHSGSVLGAGVRTDGSLGTTGTLSANAGQSIAAHGQNLSGGDQHLSAGAIDLSGSQTSAPNLSATASQGDIDFAHATVVVSQTLSANAHQTLRTDGAQVSAEQIHARAHDLSNVDGQIAQTGQADMALDLPGNLDNTRGRLASNSSDINIRANTLTNTQGRIEHAGTGTLAIGATALRGAQGTIASNGALELTAPSAVLDRATTTARQLNIRSTRLSHRGGRMTHTGSDAARIAASQQLDNTGGTISSHGATTLTVGALKNQGGSIQTAGSEDAHLTITASAGIDNGNAGSISSSGNAAIAAQSIDNTEGKISAGQALTVRTTQAIENTRGTIAATDQLSLSANQINNQAGTIGSVQGGVELTVQGGALNNREGRIEAAQTTTISASGITNTDGVISGKTLSANSQNQSFDNTRGKLIATGTQETDTLDIRSGALTNDGGLIQGASALTVDTHGQTLRNTQSGSSGGIVGQSSVHLRTGDLDNQAGYIGSKAALRIDGAALANTQAGKIVSSAAATIHADSLDNQGGQVQAVGDIDLRLRGSLDNTASLLRSGQKLRIDAQSVRNANTRGDNQGLEGKDLVLRAAHIDNTAGAIRSSNDVTLTSSASLNNAQGLISARNTLTLQDTGATKALAITNTGGTLIADRQLSVNSASLSGDGEAMSLGDLHIQLSQSHVNAGKIVANGNARVEVDATFTNQGTLTAGNTLDVRAADMDNQAGGSISANRVELRATGALDNRGSINARETVLKAQTLNNLGTGKIYGDHVAIGASTVTNTAEDGKAAVIAARNRLDVGADTIHNREHAILFSGADLAIGGGLDSSDRATGQATALNNASATIEAIGSAHISAKTVSNTNQDFHTTIKTSEKNILEYQGTCIAPTEWGDQDCKPAGPTKRYAAGTPGVEIFHDESDHLRTPDNGYEIWLAYNYTRRIREPHIDKTDPGKIISGGAMQITADTVHNDKSQIIAGGSITGAIGKLNNTDAKGQRVTTDTGTETTHSRERHKGRDKSKSLVADYKPADTVEEVSLESVVYRENADSSAGTGPEIARLSTDAVDQTPGAVGQASGSTQGAQRLTPITEVVPAARSNASGPATVVRTGGINTTVPNNSLFALTPNSAAHYLVETDPAFANYQNWLGSDYLLSALSIDPARVQKRLGDGFYEQKLIREQVAQLTGRRFLAGYENDEAQYRALMNSGVSFAKAHHLVPGVALSAAQMAQLTSDIVWLVEKDITLADGSTAKALVPQLYAQVQSGDLQAGGALIAGNNVQLNLTGNLLNSGTIAGRQVVSLSAENIDNLGGRILGQDANLAARTDLNTIGGSITASDSLVATAGRDINVESKTRTQHNAQGSRTHVDRVAGLYVTGSAGTLLASAGRNANLIAAAIQNQGSGDTRITAKNNIHLGTVTQGQSDHIVWNSKTQRSDARQSEVGTQIQAQGNLRLQAGNDLNARAADVTSTHGALTAIAGNDVNLSAGQARAQIDDARQSRSRSSIFSSKTTTRRDTLDQTTAQATTFSGKTTTILADRDITLTGSNAVSDSGTTLVAKNNVRIQAATNTTQESQFKDEKKSGIFSGGGLSVTIGTQQQSTDKKGVSTTAAASTVGSTQGDVVIRAGQSYTQTGSDVLAPQGNIAIDAKRIEVLEARETSRDQTETQFRQSGLTIALSNPVTNAIQTAEQMKSAASKTSDSRMQALALASTALSAKNAMDAVQANPGEAGGINLSISIGSSRSQSNSTQTSNRAAGSTVAAGGNVSMVASGAGQDSNLTIQGSTVKAGNNIQLSADNKVNLLAAKNTTEQHGTNKNSSASIGVSFGTDGFLVTASASRGRGKADGNDVAWTNTHVDAGNQLSIRSGGDTTLQGAVASGKQVIADVGGNLKIESLQDTSQFASTQQSVGGSISVGVGKVGGSLNISKSNAQGDFASVTEQSGIKAGDGGFQINVKGNTDLKGAVITSTDRAAQDGRNSLNTATLTQSDIQNRDNHDASGFSIGISSSGGGSAGMGSDKGSQSSTTQSGISQAAVTITDNAKQQDLTGKTAAETVATLNRDASTDKNTSAALTRARDGNQLIADVQAQSQITAAFGSTAAKAWGEYANQRQVDATTTEDAACWAPNGACRVAGHTVIGGLAGGVSGAVGTAASTTVAPLVGEAVKQAGITGAAAEAIVTAVAAGVGAAAGSAAGTAGAFNEVRNNYLTSAQWQAYADELQTCRSKNEGCSDADSNAIRSRWARVSTEQNVMLAHCDLTNNCDALRADVKAGTDRMMDLVSTGSIPGGGPTNDLDQFLGQRLAANPTYRNQVQAALNAAAICNENPSLCTQQTVRAAALVVAPLLGAAYGATAVAVLMSTGRMALSEATLIAQLGLAPYCGIKPQSCLQVAETAAALATNTFAPSALPASSLRAVSNLSVALAGTAARTTTGGFVNAAKVCKNGCTISNLTPTETALVNTIAQSGDQTGKTTEKLLTSVAQRTPGVTILPGGKYGSDNGFDLVLKDANGGVTIVMDAKQMHNNTFKLASSGGSGAVKTVQLSQAWIRKVLTELPKTSPARNAIEQAINTGTLRTAVGGVNRSTKTLTIVPVVP